ncbi:MAG: Gfo/Idh/MocA family oxidoreductase [Planctomycetota bacterium]|nr:MAG: Gfo/Idh/MocA family oxidoreductase [Planctomycetota bacterium]
MNNRVMDRRSFLRTTAGTAALGIAGGAVKGKSAARAASAKRTPGANDRISVGVVGMGVRGTALADAVVNMSKNKGVNIELAAICELWRVAREKKAAEFGEKTETKLKVFVRHEEMLEKADVDAVIITTPDFWHVPVLLDCVRAGKDAYVEKPLGVTLEEAKAARDAVHATDRVVQVGTQRRSEDKFHVARDFVKTGQLGKISTIECAFNDCSPRWRREAQCKKMKESDVDWKYYLRDRAYRPFNPRDILEWKLFRDFTMGTSGLLGCHIYDALQLVMDVPYPISAVSQGGVFVYKDGREVEDTFISLLEYPREFVAHYMTRLGNRASPGLKIRGVRGTLDAEAGRYSGEGGRKDDRLPDKPVKLTMPKQRRPSHMQNFFDCMRSRQTPIASIDVGYQHMITSVIAQEAMIQKRRLVYDPKRDRIV